MTDPNMINLRHVARGMSIPLRQIQAVVQLLEEGNTVPFITRYRKDETGGLDEVQIRQIQSKLAKLTQLAERKQSILRSIESQGSLTPELEEKVRQASTMKRLEDLYLPYKPKKQTLATAARQRGLEPFASEIFSQAETCQNLEARAAEWINPEKGLSSVEDVLAGAGHILAEKFSENAELRQRLREILQRNAKIVTLKIETEVKTVSQTGDVVSENAADEENEISDSVSESLVSEVENAEKMSESVEVKEEAESAEVEVSLQTQTDSEVEVSLHAEADSEEKDTEESEPAEGENSEMPAEVEISEGVTAEADSDGNDTENVPESELSGESESSEEKEEKGTEIPSEEQKKLLREKAKALKASKRQKELERKQKAFQDYFDYSEAIRKIPPHRVLAINRGEQGKILRVKIESDFAVMQDMAEKFLSLEEHAHAEYLKNCVKDALSRLMVPALEREIRRELTEHAENHAVEVFAKNLRNLLLQSPVHGRKVLAVDPGYKNGCKLVALDQFGNVLAHEVIYLIGKSERLEDAKKTVLDLIQKFHLSVIAIGNGTACRAAEDFFAQLISQELSSENVEYVIVNEAGASVYSTSVLGREEFPDYDAVLRGAISIGRRLQDPLSELVKIDPANIGVGLYQHDVKAKHLRQSLECVVESCVNFVGVDVNMASPALLRFVSGLNQLHARKIYEYRRQNGPFRNRLQLKEVPGIGESTFVQAAGFLKIARGDNPLDSTWIHPESYEIATKILEKLGLEPHEVRNASPEFCAKISELDVSALAKELETGELGLKDILVQLVRPGRDPREELPAPVFKKGVLKLEDLEAGMELTGTVLNVVDFGAFVDIGLHESGLVHVSQLADRFIREPHEVVAVGDIVKVWVVTVDKTRHRVSLTMIDPSAPVAEEKAEGDSEEEGKKKRSRRRRSHGKQSGTGAEKEREGKPVAGGDITSPIPPLPVGLRLVSEAPPDFVPQSKKERKAPRGKPERDAENSGRVRKESAPKNDAEVVSDSFASGVRPKRERVTEARKDMKKYQYKKESPKMVTPITEDMKKGKVPLRSFDDLAQFFSKKELEEEE
ncbi:MAG: Tex family protein [Planctomycetia bacterium]|nr:Tex family protein [Planctomycetia bacterium]